ncbi:MAG: thermonuclease family protein [Gammaproteobacteria bacterium]
MGHRHSPCCDAKLSKNTLKETIVRSGYAWVYRKYAKNQKLFQLEQAAREARGGLWRDPKPVPPWEWRRRAKK